MESRKKIIEFYKDLGVDEVLSEDVINRLKEKAEIASEGMNTTTPVVVNAQNSNIITNNFSNMTQSEAIARLVKKQAENSFDQDINSILDIVKKAEKIVSKIDNLKDLEKEVRDFDGCSLKKMATNTVFSDGDPESEIMIIGEAPGNHEDLQGIPFCGDTGKLLDAMFLAIKRPRSELYISNTLFWRPPGNRRPTDDELAICRPFVEKHIELANPKLIVLMGSTAMTSVLGVTDPISKVRGKFLDYQNKYLQEPIKAISFFHPSYLMRQPNKKRAAWQDLITIDNFIKEL